MSQPGSFSILEGHHYIVLSTFRKNGIEVKTPVWFVRQGEKVYIWTGADSGKAKRLRRNPAVRLAPSDPRGKPLGNEIQGTARILSEAEGAPLKRAFEAKYGLQQKLFAFFWRFQKQQHTYIEIIPG